MIHSTDKAYEQTYITLCQQPYPHGEPEIFFKTVAEATAQTTGWQPVSLSNANYQVANSLAEQQQWQVSFLVVSV